MCAVVVNKSVIWEERAPKYLGVWSTINKETRTRRYLPVVMDHNAEGAGATATAAAISVDDNSAEYEESDEEPMF